LPTPLGLLMLLACVAFELDAMRDPDGVKRVVAGLVLGAVILGTSTVTWLARRVIPLHLQATRVHAGAPFAFLLTLANPTKAAVLVGVRVDARDQPLAYAWLPAQGTAVLTVPCTRSLPRGVYPWPAFAGVLWTAQRLSQGRWRWVSPRPVPDAVVVWPARWDRPLPPLPGAHGAGSLGVSGEQGQMATEARGVVTGVGAEGWLREWRPGDRLAHLAHKASARRDRWLVRAQSPAGAHAGEVHLTWAWARGVADTGEGALSLLASAVEAATAQGRWVRLTSPTATFEAGHGVAHAERLLDHLARVALGAGA
jgi:hypothetical protein